MRSVRIWLSLFAVFGFCFHSTINFTLYSSNTVSAPLSYEESEAARYDRQYIQREIVDKNYEVVMENDVFLPTKVHRNTDSINPRQNPAYRRTIIPDQSAVDLVDNVALKRGHKLTVVDKNDEVVTEVVDDDFPSSIFSETTTSIPPTDKPSGISDNFASLPDMQNPAKLGIETISPLKSDIALAKNNNVNNSTYKSTVLNGENFITTPENLTYNSFYKHAINETSSKPVGYKKVNPIQNKSWLNLISWLNGLEYNQSDFNSDAEADEAVPSIGASNSTRSAVTKNMNHSKPFHSRSSEIEVIELTDPTFLYNDSRLFVTAMNVSARKEKTHKENDTTSHSVAVKNESQISIGLGKENIENTVRENSNISEDDISPKVSRNLSSAQALYDNSINLNSSAVTQATLWIPVQKLKNIRLVKENESSSFLTRKFRRSCALHQLPSNKSQKLKSVLSAAKEISNEYETAQDLMSWETWGPCSRTCGKGAVKSRLRKCARLVARNFNVACLEPMTEQSECPAVSCTVEKKMAAVQKLSSYSPRMLCGFDPCQSVGCIHNIEAFCIADFECNPTFFDNNGRVLKKCEDSSQLFLRPRAQKKCSFDPCLFAKCQLHGSKCLVDTKCRPLFVNNAWERINCKGSNVLQISSEVMCGFNPCKIATCSIDPLAKCFTDYRCKPIFFDAIGQKVIGCTEDKFEEVQQTSLPKPSTFSTENAATEIQTHVLHFQPKRNLKKYKKEQMYEKPIEPKLKKNRHRISSKASVGSYGPLNRNDLLKESHSDTMSNGLDNSRMMKKMGKKLKSMPGFHEISYKRNKTFRDENTDLEGNTDSSSNVEYKKDVFEKNGGVDLVNLKRTGHQQQVEFCGHYCQQHDEFYRFCYQQNVEFYQSCCELHIKKEKRQLSQSC
ncbi:uncharacterized protein LOC124434688 isoform X2 [Xenia sp. Carnegie-2017]|uniref:uncharacterized protein LOC124434688 isoform X2 n=1 Tax=Xenia sp. Carnegie-2017 TaxID=2897299 RepID=UPI001F041893|nr:uncharacterized protein LOC124434688 isoform X2 [Xenia sp. Carnegie-2017]